MGLVSIDHVWRQNWELEVGFGTRIDHLRLEEIPVPWHCLFDSFLLCFVWIGLDKTALEALKIKII